MTKYSPTGRESWALAYSNNTKIINKELTTNTIIFTNTKPICHFQILIYPVPEPENLF